MKMDTGGLFSERAISEKSKKNLTILNYIKNNGPISMEELLRHTEMNPASLYSYLDGYSACGLISAPAGGFGQAGENAPVELNEKIFVAGIDAGRSQLRAVMTDLSMNVRARRVLDAPSGSGEEAAAAGAELIGAIAAEAGVDISSVKAVGIGAPDNDSRAMRELIGSRLGSGAFSANDAACAAFGEKALNKDVSAENMLFIYSDTGCGIVVRDDIYFGANGSAGGVHVAGDDMHSQYLKPWGRDMGLAELARKEAAKGVGTKMVELAGWDVKGITKETVIAAARASDDVATDILSYAGRNLGMRIAYLVNLFNPEIVFIGGGLEKAGDLILKPIKEAVGKLAFAGPAGMVSILPSSLGEDAVSLGAASLAVRELFIRA